MASSRKPNADDLPRTIVSFFRNQISPGSGACVGLSGGRDSVVLLHVMVQCRAELGIELSALHVNHQISPHGARWAAFCAELCENLNVPLQIECVNVARDSGKGLEAAARAARYAAFATSAADIIVLAHHRDDQAETVLLQALRGAGLKGISGMPAIKCLQQGKHKKIVRPLLSIDTETLAAYAAQQKLEWIDDESNANVRYFRNYLRHEVLPRIAVQAPHYRDSLSRLGQHAVEAQQLLDELADIDSRAALEQGQIKLESLLALSNPRAKNLLRYFFAHNGIPVPNVVQLDEIVNQLRTRAPDDKNEIRWANRVLRCHAGVVHIDIVSAHEVEPWRISWRDETALLLPRGCGVLRLEPAIGVGIDRAKLMSQAVNVRSRIGGERFRPHASRPNRTLKKLLQEAKIPPWQRARMPLLFCGEILVWVPEIGVATHFAASSNQDSIAVSWHAAQT